MALRFKALLALAVLASLLSFAKFSHCEGSNWATPDQYIHA
ncbi:MAG: mannosyltransferase, partial [Actinobacteria bacterium]|nr:mannosyltransferase [Actinomycetota bacterium]